MRSDAKGSSEQADPTRCDREPIHIPGSIQPHGLPMAMTGPGLIVAQVSDNAESLTGIEAEAILGRPVVEKTVDEVCRLAAVEVRRITGFDRILIYRFDGDWNGTIVA